MEEFRQPVFSSLISQQNFLPENFAIVVCHKWNAHSNRTFDEIHTVTLEPAFSKAFFPEMEKGKNRIILFKNNWLQSTTLSELSKEIFCNHIQGRQSWVGRVGTCPPTFLIDLYGKGTFAHPLFTTSRIIFGLEEASDTPEWYWYAYRKNSILK